MGGGRSNVGPIDFGITTGTNVQGAYLGIHEYAKDAPRKNLRLIARNAAWAGAMPPGNVTEMTGEERATIASWVASDGK